MKGRFTLATGVDGDDLLVTRLTYVTGAKTKGGTNPVKSWREVDSHAPFPQTKRFGPHQASPACQGRCREATAPRRRRWEREVGMASA